MHHNDNLKTLFDTFYRTHFYHAIILRCFQEISKIKKDFVNGIKIEYYYIHQSLPITKSLITLDIAQKELLYNSIHIHKYVLK